MSGTIAKTVDILGAFAISRFNSAYVHIINTSRSRNEYQRIAEALRKRRRSRANNKNRDQTKTREEHADILCQRGFQGKCFCIKNALHVDLKVAGLPTLLAWSFPKPRGHFHPVQARLRLVARSAVQALSMSAWILGLR